MHIKRFKKQTLTRLLPFTAILYISTLFITLNFTFENKKNRPAAVIYQQYLKDLENFNTQVKTFDKKLRDTLTKQNIQALRENFLKMRNAYKASQYIAAYSDQEFIKNNINGAPLPGKVPNINYTVKRPPQGLQIIDELLFTANKEVIKNRNTLQEKSAKLKKALKTFINLEKKALPISDRQVFEALREELSRVFNLGLTGFDTPQCGNAMPEALIAFQQIEFAIQQYKHRLKKKNKQSLYQETATRAANSVKYLKKHQDFDTFDRLHFLTTYVNPLYKNLYLIHKALGVETVAEVTNKPQPVNYDATNLFAENLLNTRYYTSYKEGEADDKKTRLGKMLFFDPVLSGNNKRACSSCHMPEKAFTDGLSKSLAMGFEGTIKRNAPTLINSVFATRYFHDMRAVDLRDQIDHVVFNEKEFASSFTQIMDKLEQSREYKNLFREAFPDINSKHGAITKYTITSSLSAYVKSLTGFNSKFDQYVRGETKNISESIQNGFNVFMGKGECGTCHFPPAFNGTIPPRYNDTESDVIGVPATEDTINPELDADMGRYANKVFGENLAFFKFAFKIPTVRNVQYTAPYMHNGVYNSLEDVMEFYNKGGGTGLGLDVPTQTLPPTPLHLTEKEMQDVIAFMKALNDTTGLTDRPDKLPQFDADSLNNRVVGGVY